MVLLVVRSRLVSLKFTVTYNLYIANKTKTIKSQINLSARRQAILFNILNIEIDLISLSLLAPPQQWGVPRNR